MRLAACRFGAPRDCPRAKGAATMFVKSEEQKPATAAVKTAASAVMPAAQPVQPMAAPVAAKNAPSVISADLTIKGTLISERDVQLAGRVEGDIRVANLVLNEQAYVKGDVYAEEVVVKGRVEGSIRARKVHLTASASVNGDLIHGGLLAIDYGASFEGNCRADRTSSFAIAAE